MEYPEKIYKYRSLSTSACIARARQIIARREVFFPAPKTFNDPFDCRPTYVLEATDDELFRYQCALAQRLRPHWSVEQSEFWARNPQNDPRAPAMLEFMRCAAEAYLTQNLGVLSVSASNTDILMWAHYADCHTGVCFEFDSSYAPFNTLRKVNYQEERAPVRLVQDDEHVMARKSVFAKARKWDYEEEWRQISYDGPGTVAFEPQALTGIVLGARITAKNILRVRRWMRRAPHATLSLAVPHSTKYKMKILQVTD